MMRARFYVGTSPGPIADADPLAVIEPILDALGAADVQGATIIPSVGAWLGQTEASAVVELLGDYTEESARAVAEFLRLRLDQDTVLWTLEPLALSGATHRKDADALA